MEKPIEKMKKAELQEHILELEQRNRLFESEAYNLKRKMEARIKEAGEANREAGRLNRKVSEVCMLVESFIKTNYPHEPEFDRSAVGLIEAGRIHVKNKDHGYRFADHLRSLLY